MNQPLDREQCDRLIEAELILRQTTRRLCQLKESAGSAREVAVLLTLAEDALERGLATIRGSAQHEEDSSAPTSRDQETRLRD